MWINNKIKFIISIFIIYSSIIYSKPDIGEFYSKNNCIINGSIYGSNLFFYDENDEQFYQKFGLAVNFNLGYFIIDKFQFGFNSYVALSSDKIIGIHMNVSPYMQYYFHFDKLFPYVKYRLSFLQPAGGWDILSKEIYLSHKLQAGIMYQIKDKLYLEFLTQISFDNSYFEPTSIFCQIGISKYIILNKK